jgi:hypothetical protein
MGVVKTSGATDFDLGVLESVSRAAPFGPPPPETVSPDGNVYLHWQLRRDPQVRLLHLLRAPGQAQERSGRVDPVIAAVPRTAVGRTAAGNGPAPDGLSGSDAVSALPIDQRSGAMATFSRW